MIQVELIQYLNKSLNKILDIYSEYLGNLFNF